MARRTILVVTLTLVAALVGHGTSQWLAASFFDARPPPADVAVPAVTPPPTVDACAAFAAHPFFDSALVLRCEVDPPPPPVDDPTPTVTPSCNGALRLVGTVVPRDDRTSFAAIVDASGRSLLYTTGMSVGEREVTAIERDRVVLGRGSAACAVAMFVPDDARVTLVERPPPLVHASAAFDDGIRTTGPASFAIARTTLERLLTGSELLTTIRAVVHQDASGTADGARIFGVREGSVVARLGLANGDVLNAVDRYSLADGASALDAVAALRGESEVTLRITRRGMPMVLTYAIE